MCLHNGRLHGARISGPIPAWIGWIARAAIPVLPYDPGEQGDPLHAEAPVEKEVQGAGYSLMRQHASLVGQSHAQAPFLSSTMLKT